MKRIIFICLLSLSCCLSKPADEQIAGKTTQAQNVPTLQTTLSPKENSQATQNAVTTEKNSVPASSPTSNNPIHLAEASTGPNETKPNVSPSASNENKMVPEKKVTEPEKITEKTKVEPVKETESSTSAKSSSVDEKGKPNNSTKPEGKTENNITTTEKNAITPKPTEAPKKDDEKPTLQARGFDGPSFIGGIILTLGLLAIGFMGFKYYKNQNERNYHTL